jgi:hypothetical protein
MTFIGPCDHPPSQAILEELEAEPDALRRERIYSSTDECKLLWVQVPPPAPPHLSTKHQPANRSVEGVPAE